MKRALSFWGSSLRVIPVLIMLSTAMLSAVQAQDSSADVEVDRTDLRSLLNRVLADEPSRVRAFAAPLNTEESKSYLIESVLQTMDYIPEPPPALNEAPPIVPTPAKMRRYTDQQMNAPLRTTIRAGRTQEDNQHSEFSSAERAAAASVRASQQVYNFDVQRHRIATEIKLHLYAYGSHLDGAEKNPNRDRLQDLIRTLLDDYARTSAMQSASTAPSPPAEQAYISAGVMGRAAAFWDSSRLTTPTAGAFVPAAIPVPGQPFFSAPAQMSLQGAGSVLSVDAGVSAGGASSVAGKATAAVSQDTAGNLIISPQQAFLQYDRLAAGLAETAFADVDSLPETVDVIGPNARVTIYQNGIAPGQPRASAYLWRPDDGGAGSIVVVSAEQPIPEIQSVTSSSTYSSIPDFIGTWKVLDGTGTGQNFDEVRHLQVGALFRSLGREFPKSIGDDDVFGWGISLSGRAKFQIDPDLEARDSLYFSVTGGQGIAHYINDLHTAPTGLLTGGNDAALNGVGKLSALSAFAWYVAYTHNWNEQWRSTATYSHVTLDSVASQGPFAYRSGQYAGVNLLYHIPINATVKGSQSHASGFYAGLEYLYGQHETFNRASADLHRIMFVVSFNTSGTKS